jgi:hypothetical protein
MSRGNAEHMFDEPHLTKDVGLRQPPDLALPDDVHRLVSRYVADDALPYVPTNGHL